jgi:hypothetical protein
VSRSCRRHAAGWVAVAVTAAAAAVLGCAEPDAPFPIVLTAVSDDGTPLPNLAVTVGGTPGKTGADGKLQLRIVGKEGARIAIAVTTPAGFRPLTAVEPLVLRRLTELDGARKRPLPVEHTLRLSPLTRRYAVLVRAGVPGLPVEIFGTRRGVTNDKGVALFLYDGTPGDELQVKLVTDGHPELRPQNPSQSFLLAPRSDAYLVKEHFVAEVKKEPHKRRPVRVGPTRL